MSVKKPSTTLGHVKEKVIPERLANTSAVVIATGKSSSIYRGKMYHVKSGLSLAGEQCRGISVSDHYSGL